jgi:hypothetical protein
MCKWQRTAQRKRSAFWNWRSSSEDIRPFSTSSGTERTRRAVFSDPEERVQIAKAAFPFLDIGFDDVAAVSHPLVAGIALLELAGDELLDVAGDHFLPEAAWLRRTAARRPRRSGIRGARSDRMVAAEADHVVHRAARMADLQPQVPEQIEHRLDHLLGPAGRLPGRDEGDVDVGMERHLAAPIAADAISSSRSDEVRCSADGAGCGEIVDEAEDLVGEKGVSRGGFAA